MRALSSVPVLLFVVLSTACNSPLDPGGPKHGQALLVVAPSAATIKGGGKIQLNLRAQDEDGQTTRPTNVTWTSSNPKVAGVSADGVVSGLATGASQINAWWNGIQGISTVSVISDISVTKPCSDGPEPKQPLKFQALCVAK